MRAYAVAGTAVQLVTVWQYVVPITSICVTVGVPTTLAVVYLGNRIWSFNLKHPLAIYETVTGTQHHAPGQLSGTVELEL